MCAKMNKKEVKSRVEIFQMKLRIRMKTTHLYGSLNQWELDIAISGSSRGR
jgi:hypothetical protein